MRKILFALVGFLAISSGSYAQTIGGTYNVPFKDIGSDPDKTGYGPSVVLYEDASYTVQKAGTGSVSITVFLSAKQEDTIWPNPLTASTYPENLGVWPTRISVIINGVGYGTIALDQRAGEDNKGVVTFGSASTTLTIPLSVSSGPLHIKLVSPDTSTASNAEELRRLYHSIPGKAAYSLTLPGDLTNEFEKLENKIIAIQNNITALENDISQIENKITELQNRVSVNESDILELKTKTQSLQTQITNNYTELLNLISQNSDAIKDNQDRIEELENGLSELHRLVTNNYNILIQLIDKSTSDVRDELKNDLKEMEEKYNLTISDLQKKIEQLQQQHENDLKEMDEKHDQIISDLQKEIERLQQELKNELKEMDEKNILTISDLQKEIERLQQELENNKLSAAQDIEYIHGRITSNRKRSDSRDWVFGAASVGITAGAIGIYDAATCPKVSYIYGAGSNVGTIVPYKEKAKEEQTEPAKVGGGGWIRNYK